MVKADLVVLGGNKTLVSQHIAIFGGSFDPPHLGHQALVTEALNQLNIDELWLMPVGLPIHRQLSGKASPEQRMGWLKQMFTGEKRVKVMDWEIKNQKPTPAIGTLRRFHAEYPKLTPTWLMGMDSFLDLTNWVDYPEHQSLCNLAVFQRAGIKSDVITSAWLHVELQAWQTHLPQHPGHIVMLHSDLPNISATRFRQHPQEHQSFLAQSTCNAILACYDSTVR